MTAQKLARHSTPMLTAQRYTHIDLQDQKVAVDRLPSLQRPLQRAGDISGQEVSFGGTEQPSVTKEESLDDPAENTGKSRLRKRRDRDSNPGYPCGYSGFQDRKADSVSACGDNALRQCPNSVAAPIAAPNGHNLATNDNTCHLTGDLGRVIRAWQQLSAEARLMILALVSAAEASSSKPDK